MNMVSRCGGSWLWLHIKFVEVSTVVCLLIASCGQYSEIDTYQKSIDPKYLRATPIAQIVNPALYSETEREFELSENTSVKVFGSGELLHNFASSKQDYFFLGDDIELFFKHEATNAEISYIFSWGQAKGRDGKYVLSLTDSISMKGFMEVDTLKRKKYFSEIKVPFSALGITPVEGRSMFFDIAIGDTDQHFVQEGKIAWMSTQEPLKRETRLYGKLMLTKRVNASQTATTILSLFGKPKLDWKIEDHIWQLAPRYPVEHIVSGAVKDKYDLSASVKSSWTSDSLYLLVEIADFNQNRVSLKDFETKQTFHDYGWIEDDNGEIIWEMSALHSQHAGGANKNHKVDTALQLKKGKYKLKYVSDESHSFGNWDDAPPQSGFYGIVIYKEKR